MKITQVKNLLLPSLLFFYSASTSALTLFDIEPSKTKLELTGSMRVNISGSSTRTEYADNSVQRPHQSPAFTNDSSRFGFKLTQELGDGIYTVGNVEWRFRGTSDSRHNFDDIYTRQLNAGFGHKKYGELLYGNILSIADEIRRTDLANDLTISYPLLPALQRRILQYTHTINNWRFGVFYGGKSKRNSLGLDLTNKRKNVWGGGIVYTHKFNEFNSTKIAFGMIREQFYNPQTNQTTYSMGGSYTYRSTTIGLDLEQRRTKNRTSINDKRLENDMRLVLVQQLNPDWRLYGQYGRNLNKLQSQLSDSTRETGHRYTVGIDYFVIPQYVKLFTEFRQDYRKHYVNQTFQRKTKENTTAVGMRIYW
ncbi:hypothetical protein BKK54_10090 [Rodentibacter genomosp. 1]|uniref:Porin domain-containing protein n=1 Tax=Rodentibacter genomosp. 1 TaxID=1908264 RepID=A0A1V3J1N2_9PAST|nr:porin [Rodentibacter genomosp. 1]OOF48818.1 hypothetical protein BKK54_10090 [Rodentibacter genomosp. 1]